MATSRAFCYNPSPNPLISGTEQVGSIAAATGNVSINATLQWWNGPDEDLGYVIAYVDPSGDRPNAPERTFSTNYQCNIGFFRSAQKTEQSFVELTRLISGSSSIDNGTQSKIWLNTNGYWTSYSSIVIDQIRLALSTNQSVYDSATAGNFIRVTAAEYANVYSTVTGATKWIMNDTDLTSSFVGWSVNYNVSYNDTTKATGSVPANNYIIGYAFSGSHAAVQQTTYLRQGTASNGVHTKLGSNVSYTGGSNTTFYFIRKSPSSSTTTKVYLSFFTTGNNLGQVSGKSNYPIYYSANQDTNSWSLFTGGYPAFQAMSTETKSW